MFLHCGTAHHLYTLEFILNTKINYKIDKHNVDHKFDSCIYIDVTSQADAMTPASVLA